MNFDNFCFFCFKLKLRCLALITINSKRILVLLIFSFFVNIGLAQNDFESGFNFGLKVGGSKFLGEISKDFSETVKEFNNKIGFASALEVSKYFSPHFEVGIELSYSLLQGSSDEPINFSAQGFHYVFPPPPNEIVNPVEYTNKLLGQNFFLRYYLMNLGRETYFNPYIKAGVGYISYHSVFYYTDSNEIIFGKGNEAYTGLSTSVFFAGAGFKTTLSPNFYLVTSIDFNMVNYDFLDVVHNFDEVGNRKELLGLYTEFKIGIFYTTKTVTGGKKSGGKGKSGSKKGKGISNTGLPFGR